MQRPCSARTVGLARHPGGRELKLSHRTMLGEDVIDVADVAYGAYVADVADGAYGAYGAGLDGEGGVVFV